MNRTICWFVVGVMIVFSKTVGAEISIMPRLRSGVEYTDNLFLSEENEESDTITTVTPGITFDISEKTVGFTASYDPSYTMYDKQEDSDYWQHLVRATGWWQSTRHLRIQINDNYLRSQNPVTEEDLTIRRSLETYTRNTSSGRVNYQFGEDNSVYADGEYSFLENDDPEIEDSDRYGGSAGVAYWVSVRWGFDVGADYHQAKYDDGLDDYTEIGGHSRLNHRFNPHFIGFLEYRYTQHRFDEDNQIDYKVHDSAVGFEYAFDPTMNLDMSVHYLLRDLEEGDDESATPVNLSFTKQFQRGSISLSGEGGYNYTSVTAENLGAYLYYEAGVTGNYAFTRRLSGDIYGTYGYHDYKDTSPSRTDDIVRTGCGLSFQLIRWLSMRAGYTYRTVSSTIDTNDYTENRFSLMLTLAPPRPYRF